MKKAALLGLVGMFVGCTSNPVPEAPPEPEPSPGWVVVTGTLSGNPISAKVIANGGITMVGAEVVDGEYRLEGEFLVSSCSDIALMLLGQDNEGMPLFERHTLGSCGEHVIDFGV